MYFVDEAASFEGLTYLKAKKKRELEDFQIQQQKLLLLKQQQQEKQNAAAVANKTKENKYTRQEKSKLPQAPPLSPPSVISGLYDKLYWWKERNGKFF